MSHPLTDIELDTALQDLYKAVAVADGDLTAQRAALLQLIDEQQSPGTAVRTLSQRRNPVGVDRRTRSLTTAAVPVVGKTVARWRYPLLAAAAAAGVVIAASLLISSHPGGGPGSSSPVASTTASPAPVTGPTRGRVYSRLGVMPEPFASRAVQILTDLEHGRRGPWAFDNASLSGADAASPAVGDVQYNSSTRQLTVSVSGSSRPKNTNCGFDYTLTGIYSPAGFVLYVTADPGVWPGGPDTACVNSNGAGTANLTATVSDGSFHPSATSPIIDAVTGQVLLPYTAPSSG